MMAPGFLCEAIVEVLIKVLPVSVPWLWVPIKVIPIDLWHFEPLPITVIVNYLDLQLFVSLATLRCLTCGSFRDR